MGHYVTLIRYTQQGAAKIKESPKRLDAAKKAAEAAGGKIHAWYLTMGKYDAVIISEFPNDEASAKFMLSTGSMGNVTTQTLKAFTETEYRKIVASLWAYSSEKSGAYAMSFKDASGKTISDRGKYLTVWKEQADNHSESYFASFSWTDLSALPRWRTGRGVASHKLVGHAEQILQHIAIDAREAD
jgi:uncharacterized protein with GYD domain